ncbi:MAG: hypothetical protein K0S33_296 [Bacteroidetes bacterium]|jgi:putative membrane protein|nr:hypothetical protein [Bacteroidota bacterium]
MRFILKIIISTIAVLITAYLLPGVNVEDNSFFTALLVALVLAFMNTIIKPILVILTIPITVFTLGLFILVINAAIIIWASRLVDGFHVEGFWRALLFSLILSVVTWFLEKILGDGKKEER